jgi:hypothetical protein
MCDLSWEILTKALLLSCVMLFCAFMLLANTGEMTLQNYTTYLLAEELYRMPPGLLLLAVLGGAVIEDLKCG